MFKNVSSKLQISENPLHNYFEFYKVLVHIPLPQVKRNLISSIRNLIYEFPNDMLNDLRLRILGKKENISKMSKLHGDLA